MREHLEDEGETRNLQRNTLPGLSLSQSAAMPLQCRRVTFLGEAWLNQPGTVPEVGRMAGGWGSGWNVLLACCSVQASVPRGGPWTSKVPFVPFRVAGQPGLW